MVSGNLARLPGARSRKAWLKVRPLNSSELPMAALIQLDGFYEPLPWAGPALNGLARMIFRGEVISALQQKLRYSTEDKCAAAQPSVNNSCVAVPLAIASELQHCTQVLVFRCRGLPHTQNHWHR